ncbi:hypothetical protein [Acrocarpospora sp. B8E8]|uniref:hypothetical protein n=1 Tax=Acrocarpospora sp. B8E8 TaxID=3153572 RepID=UPI00325F05E9
MTMLDRFIPEGTIWHDITPPYVRDDECIYVAAIPGGIAIRRSPEPTSPKTIFRFAPDLCRPIGVKPDLDSDDLDEHDLDDDYLDDLDDDDLDDLDKVDRGFMDLGETPRTS